MHQALQVHVDSAVDPVGRYAIEPDHRWPHAGIVEPEVDAPEAGDGGVPQILQLLTLADITGLAGDAFRCAEPAERSIESLAGQV